MSEDLRVAWAAGFFDGEGHVQITRGYLKRADWGPYYHMLISATQLREEPLRELVALFGGTICLESRGLYIWTCTTRNAAAALERMLPYLRVKREQALVALAFQARRKRGGHAKADGEQDETDRQTLKSIRGDVRTAARAAARQKTEALKNAG